MSDSLAAPELQSIQCSRDPPPSMSLVVTSPEPQVLPEAVGSTPALLSDLWSQAINEAKGESGILKWLQKYGLMATDGAQQIDQSQTDEKFHVQELISLIEANKLSEQSDKPLKIPLRNQEITARDYIANAVAFITKVGDIAFSCTPMESNAPWTVTKAVLQSIGSNNKLLFSGRSNGLRALYAEVKSMKFYIPSKPQTRKPFRVYTTAFFRSTSPP
ncbi:hypothetical protein TRIATDRAFT_315380 [Trichoderma atroviride IMI 206040]|uniref:Uncharacterized protein n=1 Tax=Hypocrea atroviridis (strain ATCC 20476 / IMI 206040) TaxID=452589 RepID=G9NJE4_HYPAI|nr:uncharacterized protein TRIATDRAFT_315380 [Trichoderma atroviride IMI 206040]EHK49018.1 hypothetical protein TRIATDRAFT_315380 [Trichoderma atroviride IMI 206040]